MVRKLTIELIVQLSELQEFQDANGRSRVVSGGKTTGDLNIPAGWGFLHSFVI